MATLVPVRGVEYRTATGSDSKRRSPPCNPPMRYTCGRNSGRPPWISDGLSWLPPWAVVAPVMAIRPRTTNGLWPMDVVANGSGRSGNGSRKPQRTGSSPVGFEARKRPAPTPRGWISPYRTMPPATRVPRRTVVILGEPVGHDVPQGTPPPGGEQTRTGIQAAYSTGLARYCERFSR